MTPWLVLRLVMSLLIVIFVSVFALALTVNDPHDAAINVPPFALAVRLIAGNIIFWGLIALMRAVYWLMKREEAYRSQVSDASMFRPVDSSTLRQALPDNDKR